MRFLTICTLLTMFAVTPGEARPFDFGTKDLEARLPDPPPAGRYVGPSSRGGVHPRSDVGKGICRRQANRAPDKKTGVQCAKENGIGFIRASRLGGCLDNVQMGKLDEVGLCYTVKRLPPAPRPKGPRDPAQKPGGRQPPRKKPTLRINTNV